MAGRKARVRAFVSPPAGGATRPPGIAAHAVTFRTTAMARHSSVSGPVPGRREYAGLDSCGPSGRLEILTYLPSASALGLGPGLGSACPLGRIVPPLGIALISTVGLRAGAGGQVGDFPAPEGPKHVARGQSEAATPGKERKTIPKPRRGGSNSPARDVRRPSRESCCRPCRGLGEWGDVLPGVAAPAAL